MKALIVLHIYYNDLTGWLLGKLANINGCDWDLIVTWSHEDEATRKLVLDFKPDARFILVENVGYDVWPFVSVVNNVDMSWYDFVIKIHTKRDTGQKQTRINGLHLKGTAWRDLLVDSLLGSPEAFRELADTFAKHPDAGFVCSRKLYVKLKFKEDMALLDEELEKLGLETEERRFCAGTMFAIRPALLDVVKKRGLTPGDFPSQSKSGSAGTLAHVYERVFSLLAPAQGYKVYTIGTDRKFERKFWFRTHIQPALNFIFCLDRDGTNGDKYLTLFGFRFFISPGE